jgi:hypothetical protein
MTCVLVKSLFTTLTRDKKNSFPFTRSTTDSHLTTPTQIAIRNQPAHHSYIFLRHRPTRPSWKTMSQPVPMALDVRGAHYQRFRWLLQVSRVGSMIGFCRIRTSPFFDIEDSDFATLQTLQDAFRLLALIVRVQVEEQGNDWENIRPGSRHTWSSERLLPEALDPRNDSHDSLATNPEYTIDPSEKQFPEGSNPGVTVDDNLCLSRCELLSKMKRLLYACQDNHFSTQETWRELWKFFIKMTLDNIYLRTWHDGVGIANACKGCEHQSRFENSLFGPVTSSFWPAVTEWPPSLPTPNSGNTDKRQDQQSVTTRDETPMDSLPQAYRIALGHENSDFVRVYVYARYIFCHFVIQ